MRMVLEGVKVLDVSQVAAVPVCARHLADYGADVIHVERPVMGDSFRGFQARPGKVGGFGPPSDINYIWEFYNRNKRGMVIDLTKPGAREIIYRLVEKTDVFITNLRSFEREEFGLQYETLKAKNRTLIYGSLTGFGKKGPDRDNPGYDALSYWARAGPGYSLTHPDVPSAQDGGGVGDSVAGIALAFGVMLALFNHEKTGEGQEVDLSLLQIGVYVMAMFLAGTLITGMDFKDWSSALRPRNEHPNLLTVSYKTKDERWFLLAAIQPDRYWPQVCRAIGRDDLEHDPRFSSLEARATNSADLLHILEDAFRSRTLEEWKVRLKESPLLRFRILSRLSMTPKRKRTTFLSPLITRITVISR